MEARWITVEEKVSRGFRAKNEMRLTLAPAYASAEALEDALQQLGRSPRQSEAFLAFLDRAGIAAAERLNNYTLLGEVRRSELVDALPDGGTAAVTALVRRGLLISTAVEVGRLKMHKAVEGLAPRPLSPAQQAAHDAILAGWKEKEVVLLHGVTSSGKTEVYIELIRRTLAEGKQVLFLLPEIALTTQITDRLGRVFGEKLGVYHSKFPDNERVEMWQRQLSEKAYPLILGVRSSVFLPFRNLGLIMSTKNMRLLTNSRTRLRAIMPAMSPYSWHIVAVRRYYSAPPPPRSRVTSTPKRANTPWCASQSASAGCKCPRSWSKIWRNCSERSNCPRLSPLVCTTKWRPLCNPADKPSFPQSARLQSRVAVSKLRVDAALHAMRRAPHPPFEIPQARLSLLWHAI